MPVLTYPDAKPIDWAKMRANPKRATVMVQWDQRSQYGHVVRASLFVIAWLDWANTKAKAKYGRGITVIQTPFNTGVSASAGTHDLDYCLDVWIEGVSGAEQQRFLRFECGGAFWFRVPAQGFTYHQHGFPLPPNGHTFPTAVGHFVDGGISQGKSGYSSQIEDYWHEAYGLAGLHDQSDDPSPFPSDAAKAAGIFDLDAYINRQEQATVEYDDWSPEAKAAYWKDWKDNMDKYLDSSPVKIQTAKGTKNVPLRNAIARGAAADKS